MRPLLSSCHLFACCLPNAYCKHVHLNLKLRLQLEEGEVDYKRSRQFVRCVQTETLSGFRSRKIRPGTNLPFDTEDDGKDAADFRQDL